MQYRNIKDFNIKLLKEFSFLSIEGKYSVIGSSNLKNIHYNSDFDLETHFEVKDKNPETIYNKIYKHFKELFIKAKKDPNTFITDFKCGLDKDGEPLRWTYADIIKGINKGVSFINALKMKSTIKLDVIYLMNGYFNEISDNYYIKVGNIANFDKITRETIIKSIEDEYIKLTNEGRYYKALKRRFIIGGKKDKKIVEYINSDIGILNKAKSDISTLILLLEQKFRPVKIEDITNALQQIKYNLSYNLDLDLSNEINSICKMQKNKMLGELQKVELILENFINARAKKDFFN